MFSLKRLGFRAKRIVISFRGSLKRSIKNYFLSTFRVERVYAKEMDIPHLFCKFFKFQFFVPNPFMLARRLARRLALQVRPVVIANGQRYKILHGPDRQGGVWIEYPDGTDMPVRYLREWNFSILKKKPDNLDDTDDVEVDLTEVHCPRRGCRWNTDGICTIYVGGEFYLCPHTRLREGHWVICEEE